MLVTVYITTFNRIDLLKRAIESVLTQTYNEIELIVADDGSTDGSHEFLLEQQRSGILTAVLNTGSSKGACFGRNRAIELAKGEFITGLDDDDYFEPHRINAFISKWKELEASNVNFAGLFDSVIEIRDDGKHKYNETKVVSYADLRKKNSVGNQVFSKLAFYKSIGGFDEEMPALQDWDTWLRLTKQEGRLINIIQYSYIMDQVHGGERISEKKAQRIRDAFERLGNKLNPVSTKEKISHLESKYSYGQMNISIVELFVLLCHFRLRKVAQVIKRKAFKK